MKSRLSELGTLTAVSTADFVTAYIVDWATEQSTVPTVVPREVSEMIRALHESIGNRTHVDYQNRVVKRDACSIAGAYEPPGVDFFG